MASTSVMPKALAGYQYSPLPEANHIRLLQFLPGENPGCSMVIVDLHNAPNFIALSYTWGDPTFSHTITIDGCVLPITASLNSALEHLHSGLRRDSLLLWVDGICINQRNLAERAAQVCIMGSIYETAKCTYVWLGPSYEDSDLALDKMLAWKEILLNPENSGRFQEWTDFTTLLWTDNKELWGSPGSVEHTAWVAVYKIWERAWWRRIWIVQEVLNAKDVRIICGNKWVDWDCLTTTIFAGMMLKKSPDWNISTVGQYGLAYVERLRHLYDRLKASTRTGMGPPRLTLLGGLTRLRPQQCTDPRDKVFAVLGLTIGPHQQYLKPDYTMSLDQVNFNVVLHLVKLEFQQYQLDFLGYVLRCMDESDYFHEKKLQLTFVPNWAITTNMFEFCKTLVMGTTAGDRVYNASGTWRSRAALAGLILVVDGVFAEVIEEVTPVCEETDDVGRISKARSWKYERDDEFPYIAGGTLREAFLHTLVADVERSILGAVRRGYAVDERLLGLAVENTLALRDFAVMNNSMKSAIYGRRIFSTRKGYLGLGPAGARKGDVVCVFAGGQVLYVIRHRGDGICEFIGECYVHGLMDGEALKFESNGEVKSVKIGLV